MCIKTERLTLNVSLHYLVKIGIVLTRSGRRSGFCAVSSRTRIRSSFSVGSPLYITCRSVTDGPIYTIQPVVKPVVKPVWQPVKCLYTRYNRLSNGLTNRFDILLYRVYKHSTGCQTRLTTGLTTGCIV